MDMLQSISRRGRTSVVLVDTEDHYLDDILDLVEADANLEVLALANRLDDAFHRAVTLSPDVIIIGWSPAVRAFVDAVETLCVGRVPPQIVIVLPGDITATPGLGMLSIMPTVSFVVRSQLPLMLPRLASIRAASATLH